MTDNTTGSDATPPPEVSDPATRNIRNWTSRLQWTKTNYKGGLTVRVFTGGGSGGDAGPTQGSNFYGSGFEAVIDPSVSADFLTDINIWSRGSVSTAGVVTANTTSILIGPSGGPYITLAPGDTLTLRKKNPSLLVVKAGKATAAADTVVFYW